MKTMNSLRYDAWVFGNHEFDWGFEKLTACVARAEMPVVVANLGGLAVVRSYVIREVDGVKVGIVGLTTPGIPNWSRPRLIPGLQFADSLETLRRVLPACRREGAQVLVLVAHQGYKETGDDHANQIWAIARQFPEVDVIIGAHTHREFPEFRIGRVLYTQAGFHGQRLGRVDLVFDTDKKTLTSKQSRSIPMDASAPVDEALVALVHDDLERGEKHLARVIGEAAEDFSTRGAPRKETPIHNLLCGAIADGLQQRGVKVDAVVHGLLDLRAKLAKGPITIGDIWRVVPYENSIGVAHLTEGELREILDENVGAYDKHEFRGIWGLRWKFDPRAEEGKRVLELRRADGARIGAQERLAVAFNSYELAGGGLRWKKLREIADRPEVKLVEYDLGTREAVVEYIQRQGMVKPRVDGWWEAEDSRRHQRLPVAY